MPSVSDVIDWMGQFLRGYNMTRPGKDSSLGQDLVNAGSKQLADRAAKGQDANGQRWKANPAGYAALKSKHYGWRDTDGKPNHRTGQMVSVEAIRGTSRVTPDRVEWHYGTGDPPDRTRSPIDNRTPSQRRADQSITDREKAARNHAARPFFVPDAETKRVITEEARDALADYVRTGR